MATREEADLALQAHQETLLKNPNVAYISTVARSPEEGVDQNYIIEVGLMEEELEFDTDVRSDAPGLHSGLDFPRIPRYLEIPRKDSAMVADALQGERTIEVEVVVCGDVGIESFLCNRRPAEGGNSCGNPRSNSVGTLGMAFQLDGKVYVLSNWHVLYGNGGSIGDPIIQPGRGDGGTVPSDIIAHNTKGWLDRFRDAAIASVRNPWNSFVAAGTRCFGAIAGFGTATNNMNVNKCGRTTRATSGVVRSTNATVRVRGYPDGSRVFYDQMQLSRMSARGDSGSVIQEQQGNRVVGLLFAGSKSSTFANKIERIFKTSGTNVEYDAETIPEPVLDLRD